MQIGAVLTVEQQFSLTAPFSDLEIKKAIWSIPSINPLGQMALAAVFSRRLGTALTHKCV